MAVRYNIDRWPVAFPSRLLSNSYGEHILNIEASEDGWNGMIVGKGDYLGFEYFEEADAGEFEAKIVDQMANGNFYVLVTKVDDNCYFVYNPPVVETEWTNDFKQEKNFYIKKGELMRSHKLAVDDGFELSADGFDGEAVVGATITSVSNRKPVVSAPVSI